jgi:1-aminocyclopropane-1-carboxylate deaminase/D-cysteine desulfhydrase-like pyridoxal-dependent ACC family enzyme
MVQLASSELRVREFVSRNRVQLAGWPTPVGRLRRLKCFLETSSDLLVKRDDLTAFGFGGSKVRKLEVLGAQARLARADVLVATGCLQSNCTRAAAEMAAALGMECLIVTNGRAPQHPTGNLLLAQLLGARIQFVADRDDRPDAVATALRALRKQGRRPFEIPISAATPASALAMAVAMFELLDEVSAPDIVIVCSSSGATQAGLLLGAALRGVPTKVVGVSPDDSAPEVGRRVDELLDAMISLVQLDRRTLPDLAIEVDDRFVAGAPLGRTDICDHAVELLARTEGLFLDPVYTSRPAAALVERIRHNQYPQAKSILLWHTGGLPGLFSGAATSAATAPVHHSFPLTSRSPRQGRQQDG